MYRQINNRAIMISIRMFEVLDDDIETDEIQNEYCNRDHKNPINLFHRLTLERAKEI